MISKETIDWLQHEADRHQAAANIAKLYQPLLSESVAFSPICYLTIRVYSRPDLQLLMQLAPVWKKSQFPEGICYKADVQGFPVTIIAHEGALPGTCKVVEEEVVLPAEPAKPERRVMQKVIKCDLS